MPTNQQKKMIDLILRMQNGSVLTIGPFDELDYEMATRVSLVH